MLKKPASFVLASRRGSTYDLESAPPLRHCRLTASPASTHVAVIMLRAVDLAAASLDSLFEHPADSGFVVPGCHHISERERVPKWFFNDPRGVGHRRSHRQFEGKRGSFGLVIPRVNLAVVIGHNPPHNSQPQPGPRLFPGKIRHE